MIANQQVAPDLINDPQGLKQAVQGGGGGGLGVGGVVVICLIIVVAVVVGVRWMTRRRSNGLSSRMTTDPAASVQIVVGDLVRLKKPL